jgi:hypothetical protein
MLCRTAIVAILFTSAHLPEAVAQAAWGTAWFVDRTWVPDQDSIAGIAAKVLDPSWDKVLPLSPALFPPLSHDDSVEAARYVWAIGGDVNRESPRVFRRLG